MIKGIHGLLYSSDAEATRAFFRDKVRLPGTDIGEGWWIYDFAEGDLGIHPAGDEGDAGKHDVSFYCEDIRGTVKELSSRGVTFTAPVEDHGYGWVTYFEAPGGITVQLYEPRYTKRRAAPPRRKAAPAGKARKARAAKKSRPTRGRKKR